MGRGGCHLLFFKLKKVIYFWLHGAFIAAPGLSLVWPVGATLYCSAETSHRSGIFSTKD